MKGHFIRLVDPEAIESLEETCDSNVVMVGMKSGKFFEAIGNFENLKQKVLAAKKRGFV